MEPERLPKTLRRWAAIIDDVSDERYGWEANGYWVYLIPGFINPNTETHQVHESTLRDCADHLRDVIPCSCEDCEREQAMRSGSLDGRK